MAITVKSICRTCHNYCAVLVDVEDNRVLNVTGDPDDPLYHGYACGKGRRAPQLYDHPARLTTPLKRDADGVLRPVALDQAIQEVAHRLSGIIAEHGPRAVAHYQGTFGIVEHPASGMMMDAFLRAIGSPMFFSAQSIDQSGKLVAKSMHGMWMASGWGSADPDLAILFGKNPLVSHLAWAANPGDFYKDMNARNATLIVVDPRLTESARRAKIHLAPLPGHDAAIAAAMLKVILDEGLHDDEFIAENVDGVDNLRTALLDVDVEQTARRADIAAPDLVEVARRFAAAERPFISCGTGPNMSGDPTLLEYLLLCLHSVCGKWRPAGAVLDNAMTLAPEGFQMAVAQAVPPWPGYGVGESSRVRGLGHTGNGMPTATLAEEILLDGPGQVRALLSTGGNPVAAWPDQEKTAAALRELELLVVTDVVMSATGKLADYVFPMKLPYEQPGSTVIPDFLASYDQDTGLRRSYANYTPALVEAPEEVLDHPTFIFKLAQSMGVQLEGFPGLGFSSPVATPTKLDMSGDLDMDALFDIVHKGSRIPLDAVRAQDGGVLYPDPPVTVAPKEPGWPGRLDVGNQDMMTDLTALTQRPQTNTDFPFRLISRRMPHVYNSPNALLPRSRPRYNPAFMNPDDLSHLGHTSGTVVEIRSPHSSVTAVVESDDTVRRGVISMSHAWGDIPESDGTDDAIPGASTGRLVDNAAVYDRYTGQPQMSNIPVKVFRAPVGGG